MTKMILLTVIAGSLAFCGASGLATESDKPSLAWTKAYVGKDSTGLVWDGRFPLDVKAYFPHIPITLEEKPDTSVDTARNEMNIPNTVYMSNGWVLAAGCAAHACGLNVTLVLADTNPKSPSLMLAFAIQQANQGGHATPPVLMKLYIYSSGPLSILSDPQVLTMISKGLQDNFVGHIDQTLLATANGFSVVPTPNSLKLLPRKPSLLH